MWIFLVLFYGIVKGTRDACKKKALEKNGTTEVLVVYTFLSLIIVTPQMPNAGGLSVNQYLGVALKSFVIFIGWMAGFKAIKKLPISMYGILDLSRVLFATVLGIAVLKESVTINKMIGLVLVCAGLLFLKFNPFKKKTASIPEGTVETGTDSVIMGTEESTESEEKKKFAWFVFLAFVSCIFNAVSGFLDKVLMKNMNSSQLQVWYTVFLFIYYLIYTIITRTKISMSVFKNVWVYLLAVLLIMMDKALFIANGMEESQITVMTLIKQSSVIVSIIAGKFVFKEKDIIHKIICASIVVAGIIIGVC